MREKLAELHANNEELSTTLKTVVSSHCSLQMTLDSLQSDVAQRDSQLTQLCHDLTRLTTERDDAVIRASTVVPSTGCTV